MSFIKKGFAGSRRARILLSLGATGTARVLTIAYNFFLVPILLSAWGVQEYGEWVILTSAAMLASMSNIGFVQASASELIILISAGKRDEAQRVFTVTIVSVSILIAVLSLITALALAMIDPGAVFAVKIISGNTARIVVGFAFLSVMFGFYTAPLAAAASAVLGGGPPQFVMTAIKVIELIVTCIVVWLGCGPITVAAVIMLTPVVSNFALWVLGKRSLPWLNLSLKGFDRATFRKLLHPSLSQFLLFISVNLMAIQIPRIVLGHLGGGVVVALFAITVTYTRTARQLSSFLGQSLQVELSRAHSEGQAQPLLAMIERMTQFATWSTLVIVGTLWVAEVPLIRVWTHGKVHADPLLVFLLSVAAVVGAFGDNFTSFLSGLNRVGRVAIGHFVATLVALGLAVASYPIWGVYGFAAWLIGPDLVMAIVGLFDSARIVERKPASLIAASLQFPGRFMLKELQRVAMAVRRAMSGSG